MFEPGHILADTTVTVTREHLVRYAGASGDFNPIHYRDDVAAEVGLPGVLAHGMLTMGIASAIVGDAISGKAVVREYGVRFTRPVVVDPKSGAQVRVVAKVAAVDEAGIKIGLTVTSGEAAVLGKAQIWATAL